MTIQEFKTKYGLEDLNIFVVDGHLYTTLYPEHIPVKLEINKNIVFEDLKDDSKLSIVNYLNGYVMTKDGTIQPYGIKLDGNWKEGWALDLHTLSSILVDPDIRKFDTKRTPIGEELFLLKYRDERHRTESIANAAAAFLTQKKNSWQLDVIIPIPPSEMLRKFQPVYEMAKSIGKLVELPVDFNTLKKVKSTSQIKDVEDPKKRREILKNAFDIKSNSICDKNVLLFDDLYRSGETLNAVCDVIMIKGKARGVYVLTITKTRSKR